MCNTSISHGYAGRNDIAYSYIGHDYRPYVYTGDSTALPLSLPAKVKAHPYTSADQIRPFKRFRFTHRPTLLAVVGVGNSSLSVMRLPGIPSFKKNDLFPLRIVESEPRAQLGKYSLHSYGLCSHGLHSLQGCQQA